MQPNAESTLPQRGLTAAIRALVAAALMMTGSSALAGPVFVSTGDLGDNVINDAGDFLWAPLLTFPTNTSVNDVTVKYGLWDSPDVTVDLLINTVLVGSFVADRGYISPGPEFITFNVTGLLVNGVNSFLFTRNSSNNGDYVIGQVDLVYDSQMIPEPGVSGLIGLGLLALAMRRRGSRRT